MNEEQKLRRKEEIITRWLDGELVGEEKGELEAILAAEPGLRLLQECHAEVKAEVGGLYRDSIEPASPEFFNTHLQRLVEREEEKSLGPIALKETGFSLKDFFFHTWLGPSVALGIVMAFLLGTQFNISSGSGDYVSAGQSQVYLPNKEVKAEVWEHQENMVVVLKGLPPLPDSLEGDSTTSLQGGNAMALAQINAY